ncbi:MAG: type III secretion system chaperone [Rhodocyclaceae bacterium]|nr:type III secretion system chaperone [Rhodocyclaceae bacterium]
MDAFSLIALFGQESGTALTLGESGTAALAVDGGPTLHLEHDPAADLLHCYVVIGQAPGDDARRGELFRQMLAANAFGRDTDGATLGLDEVSGELVLSRRLELARADTAWLRATFESMAAVATHWQTRQADPAPSTASDAAMPDFGIRA